MPASASKHGNAAQRSTLPANLTGLPGHEVPGSSNASRQDRSLTFSGLYNGRYPTASTVTGYTSAKYWICSSRPHQSEDRIVAHIFLAFLAYCLQVALKAKLRPVDAGITPREVLAKSCSRKRPETSNRPAAKPPFGSVRLAHARRHAINRLGQCRQVMFNGKRDRGKVDPQVAMHDHVSKPCELAPRDLRLGELDLDGQALA